jgi:lipopolysaccharide transport system ATP-binding protein
VAKKHIDANFGFRVKDQMERNIFTSEVQVSDFITQEGIVELNVAIPAKFLVPNKYQLVVGFHVVNLEMIKYLEGPVQFIIEETGTDFFKYAGNDYGSVFVDCKWVKC